MERGSGGCGLGELDREPVNLLAIGGAERQGRILNRVELVTAVNAMDHYDHQPLRVARTRVTV